MKDIGMGLMRCVRCRDLKPSAALPTFHSNPPSFLPPPNRTPEVSFSGFGPFRSNDGTRRSPCPHTRCHPLQGQPLPPIPPPPSPFPSPKPRRSPDARSSPPPPSSSHCTRVQIYPQPEFIALREAMPSIVRKVGSKGRGGGGGVPGFGRRDGGEKRERREETMTFSRLEKVKRKLS